MSTPTTTTRPSRFRDPLQPLVGLISVGYYLALAAFLIGVYRVLFASGGSFGWNGGAACLDVPAGLQSMLPGPGEPRSAIVDVQGLHACIPHAGSAQAFYSTLANGLGLPFFLITFGLTSRLLTVAAKGGVYRSEVVSRVHLLAWTLIVGEAVVVVLRVFGSVHLFNDLAVAPVSGVFWLPFWHVNFIVLLIGVVLLSVARILREGVGMREDLEGTV